MVERVSTPGATPEGRWTYGDPRSGNIPTKNSPPWMNSQQEEPINLIQAFGLSPEDGNWTQLRDALFRAIGWGASGATNNWIDNPSFYLWRHGATRSIDDSSRLGPDRFRVTAGAGGSGTVERADHVVLPGGLPPGTEHYLRWTQSVAGAGPRIESRTDVLLRQTSTREVTFSFYARSPVGSVIVTPRIEQMFGLSSLSPPVVLTGDPVGLDSTWKLITMTVTLPSIANKDVQPDAYLSTGLELPSGQLFTMETDNWRLNLGPIPMPFEMPSPAHVVQQANRYFWSTRNDSQEGAGTAGRVYATVTGTRLRPMAQDLPVEMRAVPTVTWQARGAPLNTVNIVPDTGIEVTVNVVGVDGASKWSTGFPIVDQAFNNQVCGAHVTANAEL